MLVTTFASMTLGSNKKWHVTRMGKEKEGSPTKGPLFASLNGINEADIAFPSQ